MEAPPEPSPEKKHPEPRRWLGQKQAESRLTRRQDKGTGEQEGEAAR